MQLLHDAKPGSQRRGQKSQSGGGPDQGKFGQRKPDAAGQRALAHHDGKREVLHGWVKYLFDIGGHPVYFVDEQNVIGLNVGEYCRQIAGSFKRRSGSYAQIAFHLPGYNAGQGRFAKARRPVEERVVKRFFTLQRSLHIYRKLILQVALTNKIIELLRTEGKGLLLFFASHSFHEFILLFGHIFAPTVSAARSKKL